MYANGIPAKGSTKEIIPQTGGLYLFDSSAQSRITERKAIFRLPLPM